MQALASEGKQGSLFGFQGAGQEECVSTIWRAKKSIADKAKALEAYFLSRKKVYAPLAQLVEQLTLNQWVPGSNP